MKKINGEPSGPCTWKTGDIPDMPVRTFYKDDLKLCKDTSNRIILPLSVTVHPCTINGIPTDQLPEYIHPIKKSALRRIINQLVTLFHKLKFIAF